MKALPILLGLVVLAHCVARTVQPYLDHHHFVDQLVRVLTFH